MLRRSRLLRETWLPGNEGDPFVGEPQPYVGEQRIELHQALVCQFLDASRHRIPLEPQLVLKFQTGNLGLLVSLIDDGQVGEDLLGWGHGHILARRRGGRELQLWYERFIWAASVTWGVLRSY